MWKAIGSFLLGITGFVLKAFKPYLRTEAARIVAELLPYAKDAVLIAAEEAAGLSGTDKRDYAVAALKKNAGRTAEKAAKRVLHQAIEDALELVNEQAEKIEQEAEQR